MSIVSSDPILPFGKVAVLVADTSPDTGSSKPVDQPSATPVTIITPATSPVGDPSSQQTAAVEQNNTEVEQQRSPQPRRSSSPPDKYPFAQRTNEPGFYRSPYTGRIYDLRRLRDGALVRDPDTGQLFRRPRSR